MVRSKDMGTPQGRKQAVFDTTKSQVRLSVPARQKQVAFLYMKGEPICLIAQVLKIPETLVNSDLNAIRIQWKKEAAMLMDERKAKELARIDKIEEEAWNGWLRSIEMQTITTRRVRKVRVHVKGGKKAAHKMVPAEESEDQVIKSCSGDPRFLEQIERCVTLRLKLFALLKGDNVNQNQVFINWAGLVGRGETVNPVEEKIIEIERQSMITNGYLNDE